MLEQLDGTGYVVKGYYSYALRLKGAERDVYAIIKGFTEGDGKAYYGGIKNLCKLTGYCRKTIKNALDMLEVVDLITVEYKDYGDFTSTVYTANLEIEELMRKNYIKRWREEGERMLLRKCPKGK